MKHLVILFLFLSAAACDTEVKHVNPCGDGILDPGEACDGPVLSVARCTDLNFYEQQGELACRSDCTLDLTVCTGTCGDGIIQTAFSEQCEGEDLGGHSCAELNLGGGTLACTAGCRLDASGCELSGTCGDGAVNDLEEACDGDDLAGRTCQDMGQYEGTLACTDLCQWDMTGCGGACGDDVLQADHETCDGTDLGTATCRESGRFSGELACDDTCALDAAGCADAASVTGGYIHTCARLTDGAIRCWGVNNNSQLGTGDASEHTTPAQVHGLLGGTEAVASGNSFACALRSDGRVVCWGANDFGQLGYGTLNQGEIPVEVFGVDDATSLACGLDHTCVVRLLGEVWCWGANDYHQVGPMDGDVTMPTAVPGVTGAVAVVAGAWHTCALVTGGQVLCWGRNNHRQMGNSSTEAIQATPAPVADLINVVALGAGNDHTCAILNNGSVHCWGRNDAGQLGDGTTNPSASSPVPVIGLVGAIALEGGASFTCTILSNGSVRCWGANVYGQLGNGTTNASSTPVNVSGLTGVTSIGLGDSHACAVSGGMVWCWGYNEDGETGDGTTRNNRLTPVQTLP
ncbi:MAG: hypothetical protein CVU65_17705 [Deltaproteobacteria bacterium HGW-Deltaproteobacteria-22]|nr:MAG: hypothetical protein CVU65_17705 [Deltaproteobacteria bacterium HGW-Deltaproteobacteria-22]